MEAGDMVSKIASLGAGGNHKSNIERDFHTLLKSFSRRLGAELSTVRARTGMFFSTCGETKTQKQLVSEGIQ